MTMTRIPKITVQEAWRPASDISSLPLRVGPTNLMAKDPAVQTVVDDVLNKFKYSFSAAAANVPMSKPSAVDVMFREFIVQRPPDVRAKHAAKATALLNAPSGVRQ